MSFLIKDEKLLLFYEFTNERYLLVGNKDFFELCRLKKRKFNVQNEQPYLEDQIIAPAKLFAFM
jgi:hypothetical protein